MFIWTYIDLLGSFPQRSPVGHLKIYFDLLKMIKDKIARLPEFINLSDNDLVIK